MTAATLPRFEMAIVTTIARKELRDAVRNKWFWLYAIAFAGLAGVLTTLALPSARVAGYGGAGHRTGGADPSARHDRAFVRFVCRPRHVGRHTAATAASTA